MKNLKLLSKKLLIITLTLFASFKVHSSDKPVDIWKENEKKSDQNSVSNLPADESNNLSSEISIYNKKSNDDTLDIVEDISLNSKKIKISGLYDPQDYDLNINMWSNSDGDQLKDLFGRITRLNLSEDASELMNISILTNAHYPKKKYYRERIFKIEIRLVNKKFKF